MAWLAVDKNGSEYIFSHEPMRNNKVGVFQNNDINGKWCKLYDNFSE